ncbi:MAG TPA: hypothetical protein VL306_01490 [Methylomirabilota bacterium]|nr:hypothetical protein [Methylomirabilota bacterium]
MDPRSVDMDIDHTPEDVAARLRALNIPFVTVQPMPAPHRRKFEYTATQVHDRAWAELTRLHAQPYQLPQTA